MMKSHLLFLFTFSLISFLVSEASANWGDKRKQYSCLEVEKFQVDRENYSNKALERAANIPQEDIEALQHKIVGEVVRAHLFEKVTKAEEKTCSGNAVVFGGVVTDYKKGSRAARIFIGLGAGKQKFAVDSYLKDKKTGEVLAKKEVIDRKFGGWAGGDEDKGRSDFAEKVMAFIKNGD